MSPTTTAAKRGGKFATMCSQRPRGKFSTPKSSSSPDTSSSHENTTDNKNVDTKHNNNRINRTKESLTISAKLKIHPVFNDLDEAERMVLDLLSLSSSTADSLSKLTQQEEQNDEDEFSSSSDLNKKNHTEPNAGNTLSSDETITTKVLSERIRQNGKNYVAKLERIYSLLEPHAHLVCSYCNLSPSRISKNDDCGEQPHQNESLVDTSVSIQHQNNQGSDSSTVTTNNKQPIEEILPTNNNMYASRLEMRLSLERRDLMQELVRLEKDEMSKDYGEGESGAFNSIYSMKRKRS